METKKKTQDIKKGRTVKRQVNMTSAKQYAQLKTELIKPQNQTIKAAADNKPSGRTAGAANRAAKPNPNTVNGGAPRSQGRRLKVIPLGGLDEIGKNLTVFEYGNDIIVVDCGLAFPGVDMLGVDLVLPNLTYLEKNKHKIRAVFLTHGHEDHIGGLPYFLKQFNVPIYGNRLTIGLVRKKLAEFRLESRAILTECSPGVIINSGCFSVEFIKVNHSIADSAAFAIKTPVGYVIHTGDFKIDTTPIMGRMIDLARFGELGKQGVLLLMSDSTNAERPGTAMSEKKVGNTLETLFARAEHQRIIVASFASNVHRVQQIINAAVMSGRKVAISGRSMENVAAAAQELGYLKIPKGTLIPLDQVKNYPKQKVVLITTGSQGEPMSALYRMAFSDHRTIAVGKDDMVIISASPIPGNELLVSKVINELNKLGAEVISNSIADVHVSGHACQEELKLILGLVKPKFFMPVHGEYKHLICHAELAKQTGVDERNIFVCEIGNVLEMTSRAAKITGSVPSGKVLVDGLGVGDVGSIVLRDRKLLSQDGIIIVVAGINVKTKRILSGPDIVSRGFVYVRENGDMIGDAKQIVKKAIENNMNKSLFDWNTLKNEVRDGLAQYIASTTKRHPIIIPIIMDL